MQQPITVNKLKKLCEEQIKKGNGNKVIMISSDDEGNEYHYLWYDFSDVIKLGAEDFVLEDIAKIEETIILG